MDISINTAQNVSIAYVPAGIANRIFATAIDFALLGGISILFTAFTSGFGLSNSIYILFFTIIGLYHLLCEVFFNGRSIGKMVLNLRVVRLDGKKVSFWDYFLRWMLRLVDISISVGIIAMLSIVLSKKMQRLGDIAAGTTVIYEKPETRLSQITALSDTPEGYEITFPEVSLLSDKDIRIIREVLKEVKKNREYTLLTPLCIKIKELTGIQTEMENLEFVSKVIQDYQHVTQGKLS